MPADQPASLRDRIQNLLLNLPPVQRVDQRLHQAEEELLRGLKQRLEEFEQVGASADDLGDLLRASLEQDPDSALLSLTRRLAQQCTPDEARILAALSDGSRYPALSIQLRRLIGDGDILYRYSSVGRAAGIQCRELTPLYLANLQQLGLVVLVPETASMKTEYELCETDSDFRRALAGLGDSKVRVVRHTLIMSPACQTLWQRLLNSHAQEEMEE